MFGPYITGLKEAMNVRVVLEPTGPACGERDVVLGSKILPYAALCVKYYVERDADRLEVLLDEQRLLRAFGWLLATVKTFLQTSASQTRRRSCRTWCLLHLGLGLIQTPGSSAPFPPGVA
jgi:hypothetical protein